MILTYFLPMAIMTALYAAIGRELWGQKAIGEATAVQVESIKSKRRVSCFCCRVLTLVFFYNWTLEIIPFIRLVNVKSFFYSYPTLL